MQLIGYEVGDTIPTVHYVDRGDPTNYDFVVGDFTTDGAIHDLDLSSICSADSANYLVHLLLEIQDNAINTYFQFQKKGNVNEFNALRAITQVANQSIAVEGWILMDANRKISYKSTNTVITAMGVTVRGWYELS